MDLSTCSLIWFDSQVNSSESDQLVQQRIRSIVNSLRIFEHVEQCIENIRLSTDQQIMLVLNGEVSATIISHIHHLPQVIAIYLYNINENQHKQFSIQYCKIKGFMLTIDDVISRIEIDQNIRERKQTAPIITVFDQSSTNINGDFLHSELIVHALVRMNSHPSNQADLIKICREKYNNNLVQLKLIDEFERDYTPRRALWWYTRETFLYKVLNQALREHDVDLLLLFQFLIRDIYEQLQQLQKNQLPLSYNRVYRGQLMSEDEIGRLMSCEGQSVSMNSFLSTSPDRNYALALVESGLDTSDEFRPVLFEIDLDQNMSGLKPYADISRESAIPTEDETLIMLGSVFRLQRVYSENRGQSWIIQLVLSNADQNQMRELFDDMIAEAENENVLYSLAYVLTKSGHLTIAERCYRRYLSEQSEDTVNAGKTYQALSSIAQRRDEYESALMLSHKAIAIFNRTLPAANPFTAITYSTIGSLYLRKNETEAALSFYEKALNLFIQVYGEENSKVTMCYNNIGLVHQKEKNYHQALRYYQQALDVGEKTLPSNHPNLGTFHMNIGRVHAHMKQYDLALTYFEQSLEIKRLSLPSDHPDIADVYANMAAVYERQKNPSRALVLYERAQAIFVKKLPPTHARIITTAKYIENLREILS